jgi:hypothetical protein
MTLEKDSEEEYGSLENKYRTREGEAEYEILEEESEEEYGSSEDGS